VNEIQGNKAKKKQMVNTITEAFYYAKRMDERLMEYSQEWNKDIFTESNHGKRRGKVE
jgi:hypothetical protein